MSGCKWSAIHREATVQSQCISWLFAYFEVAWVVHGCARGAVPCSGRDAMEVTRGGKHMPSLGAQTTLLACDGF